MTASQEDLKEHNGVAIGPYTRQWVFTSHPTGWLHKQVYDLKRKTTIKVPKPDDVNDLFEDVPAENDLVTNEQFDIYTILDEANREAGRLVLDLKTDKHSKRLDNVLKRTSEL
ncbi:hypothetical protein V2W45_1338066 [Cenococcum geophilum]